MYCETTVQRKLTEECTIFTLLEYLGNSLKFLITNINNNSTHGSSRIQDISQCLIFPGRVCLVKQYYCCETFLYVHFAIHIYTYSLLHYSWAFARWKIQVTLKEMLFQPE